MKTSIFFNTLLIASSLSISQAQTTNSLIVDEDGILNIVDKPFDVNRFVIGRDFHENKFSDQNKGLQGMADCYFNMSDASDGTKQNFKLCKKLGLNTVVSAEGRHLTGKDWITMAERISIMIKNKVVIKERDAWSDLANFIGEMVAKYADAMELDQLPDPDNYLRMKRIKQLYMELYKIENIEKSRSIVISIKRNAAA